LLSPNQNLQGKRILVTGASSGIGNAIAVACANAGAIVISTGRNRDALDSLTTSLDGDGHSYIVADLTDTADRDRLVQAIPPVDGVVHAAGIGQTLPAKFTTEQDVDKVFDINFKAPVMLQTQLITNKKIAKGASIVFIASITATKPMVGNSLYSASKAALVSYARVLALELAPRKIRVNCISPAMVWTKLLSTGGISLEQLKADEQTYPLKRYGQPEDIAPLSVYLLSEASSWMTGSNIDITGGIH